MGVNVSGMADGLPSTCDGASTTYYDIAGQKENAWCACITQKTIDIICNAVENCM